MSRRVTRSSARQSADISALSEEPPPPTDLAPSPSSRKRKAPAQDSTTEETQTPPRPTSHRRKRRKPSPGEAPEPAASSSRPKRKSRTSAVMSSTGSTPSEEQEKSTAIPTASSSKKKGKSRKTPTDDNQETPSAAATKRSRSSTNKKGKKTTTQTTPVEPTAGLPVEQKEQDREDAIPSEEDEEVPPEDYDEDEAMADDPFESAFLSRADGPGGMSSALRALSGMMAGTSSRLRSILEKLKDDDPTTQHIALSELSELLLVSTEDNLAGNFSPDQFLKELVKLMQPNEITGEANQEIMLLACRCIANMMEALPASTASVVYGDAVPVLVSKLLEIEYMDLAEQALITLEKISAEFPASIVREGGLTACLTYLDFFPTSVQRTAVTTAANCCRNIPAESFSTAKDVMPILLNVLDSSDQRVVEQGCLCLSRIVESFKYEDDKLEELMNTELLRTILRLLLPGSTNLISTHIQTQFLRVLSITARSSATLTVELFKMNVVETLYQVLTGVSPPSGIEGVAQKIDSVVIMQALIHRPRDQIFETLNVICELLPGFEKGQANFINDLAFKSGQSNEFAVPSIKQNTLKTRLELLSSCKDELRRFAVVLLPTLTDAYSSTVNLSVRQKVLVAQLKMLSYLDTDILEDALRPVPYSSYLASMLSQQDHPYLVTSALQAAVILLKRLEHVYRYQFYREGVLAEIRKLADRPVEIKPATAIKEAGDTATSPTSLTSGVPQDGENVENRAGSDDEDEDGQDPDGDGDPGHEDGSDSSDSEASPPHPATVSSPSNIQDRITGFAKRFIEMYENESGRQSRDKAAAILETLQNLVSDITSCYDSGRSDEGSELFTRLAKYFEGDALESITSYELLTSRVVSTLLDVLQEPDGRPNEAARSTFIETFMGTTSQQKLRTAISQSTTTPFSILVHKLQDLLSRAEHFEVLTVHSNTFDSNRSSAASMLAKQIRVRLVADDESGIPRTYRSIMVSIHAIATFKALDDYLRPRISLAERARTQSHRIASTAAATAFAAAIADHPPLERPSSTPATPASDPTVAAASTQSRSSARKSSRSKPPTATNDDGLASHPDPSTPMASSSRKATRTSNSRLAEDIQSPSVPPALPAEDGDQRPIECADEARLSEDEGEDGGPPFDEIVDEFDEEMEDNAPDPTAVNLEIAPTGKVTARQEDGTRVETPTSSQRSASRPAPTPARNMPPPMPPSMTRSLLSSLSHRSMSYAAALQVVPQDWHLEFSVNGEPISNETTIYRAVQFSKASEDAPRNIWSQVHSINFKRVDGPPPAEPSTLTPPPDTRAPQTLSGMPQSLEKNPVSAEILRLLRILHEMNSNLDDVLGEVRSAARINAEPLAQFVNTKLTAKLNRQLEEPLIVASNCLPSWSEDLARLYPFLFPFETRHLFIQSTSFGYSRSMSRWQNGQSANDSRRERHRDERPFLGRLQRQKVRISRQKILESALKVMELYGASPSVLEVEFFEEVGTGLGPTLEFYSNVSKEFCKKKLKMWRENESGIDEFAFGKLGLFPAPISEEHCRTENGQKVLMFFKMLGKFVARSMLDSRIIDVSFNPMFFRLSSGQDGSAMTLAAIRSVDTDLAQSLQTIKQFVNAKKKIEEQTRLTLTQKAHKLSGVQVAGATIDDLGLDFTLPGYPSVEMIPNGSNIEVTIDNVGLYLDKVIDYTLGKGVRKQVDAFKTGFSQVFPYSAMMAFTPQELVMLFGRNEEDWSMETLMDSTKADHGYNLDSKSVRNLLQSMSELTLTQKRDFLQFITGSPKLPIGGDYKGETWKKNIVLTSAPGFKSLTPMFTVVCKPSEEPYKPDDYLPSVMTCVNYLKLPDYSSLDVMRKQLAMAIEEGQGAFHLS